MQMWTGLNLDRDDVGAGTGEFRNVPLGLHDHQMHVQRLGRDRSKRLNDQGTDGDVRHKTTIHHVHMDPISTGLINGPHVLTQS
jgi:hypothetical protein